MSLKSCVEMSPTDAIPAAPPSFIILYLHQPRQINRDACHYNAGQSALFWRLWFTVRQLFSSTKRPLSRLRSWNVVIIGVSIITRVCGLYALWNTSACRPTLSAINVLVRRLWWLASVYMFCVCVRVVWSEQGACLILRMIDIPRRSSSQHSNSDKSVRLRVMVQLELHWLKQILSILSTVRCVVMCALTRTITLVLSKIVTFNLRAYIHICVHKLPKSDSDCPGNSAVNRLLLLLMEVNLRTCACITVTFYILIVRILA